MFRLLRQEFSSFPFRRIMHRMATVSEMLARGLEYHQAGRLAEAEGIYRQILASSPNQAQAWHLLGALAYQRGNLAQAIEYTEHAVALKPELPKRIATWGWPCTAAEIMNGRWHAIAGRWSCSRGTLRRTATSGMFSRISASWTRLRHPTAGPWSCSRILARRTTTWARCCRSRASLTRGGILVFR